VPNPNTTTNFDNHIVTTDTIVSGKYILTKSVTVNNNAKLTLNPVSSVIINAPFTINVGSQFEIVF